MRKAMVVLAVAGNLAGRVIPAVAKFLDGYIRGCRSLVRGEGFWGSLLLGIPALAGFLAITALLTALVAMQGAGSLAELGLRRQEEARAGY